MCETCDAAPATGRPTAALTARIRAIEATLPGERVGEEAFAVFLGARGGAIPWPQYQRLLRCRDAAAANAPIRSFRCEAG
ncbi:MAG: hypothetical protein ACREFY_07795 [Acetobacteraceae bacterium]